LVSGAPELDEKKTTMVMKLMNRGVQDVMGLYGIRYR
jgi:hypothetical protein